VTDLVKANGNALAMKIQYAERLAQAGLLPAAYRQQPANVLLIVEQAEALGVPFASALNGIHVIDGKPTISPALMSALVRRAGHKLRVTGSDTKAVAEIIRADDPDFTFRSEWTLERAKQAGLAGRGSWGKYPAAMLKARAISEVCRDACQEVVAGVYTPEELGADVTVDVDGDVVASAPSPFVEPVEDVVDAELVDEGGVELVELPNLSALIAEVGTVEGCRELWRDLEESGELDQYRDALLARVDELKGAL